MSLRVRQLSKSFAQPGGRPLVALTDCSFDLEPERLTVLMGPSGSGKSTLAYLLAGYLTPDSGSLTLDDVAITKAGSDRLLVFQETALWPWMTVIENVMFGPIASQKMSRSESHKAAQELLRRFGLGEFAERYPNQLSGGMKRRAELAQALINSPKLMILDEPFRGLDVMTRELMQEYLLRLFEETRSTILFITSELEEAIFLADRILFMSASPGKIVRSMDVDLPHPRTFETMTSDLYLKIKKESLETLIEHGALHQEA
jgi:NitT/TauT family transport system ATP-binding protein